MRLQQPQLVVIEARVSACGQVSSPAWRPISAPSMHALIACWLGLVGFAPDLARGLFGAYCGRSHGRGPALRRVRWSFRKRSTVWLISWGAVHLECFESFLGEFEASLEHLGRLRSVGQASPEVCVFPESRRWTGLHFLQACSGWCGVWSAQFSSIRASKMSDPLSAPLQASSSSGTRCTPGRLAESECQAHSAAWPTYSWASIPDP